MSIDSEHMYDILEGSSDGRAQSATTANIFLYSLSMPWSHQDPEAADIDWDFPVKPRLVVPPCRSYNGSSTEGLFANGSCNELCTDPKVLFSSWEILAACLGLASLALTLIEYPDIDDKVDGEVSLAVSRLHVAGNITEDFGARDVLEMTVNCARASCVSDGMGPCNMTVYDEFAKFFNGSADGWWHFDGDYCDGIEGSVNVDIAGPGVLFSYMLQSCLAVVLWFAVRLGTMKSTFPNLFRRPEDGAAPNRLATLFERFSKTNFFYSTACFLADFHESQCFFIIAVSIALLYANGQPASFNGAENWESLIINQDYINLIASAGALPPILTQLSLHRLGMDSVYGLLCSTVAVLMAGVTLTQLLVLRAEQVWVMFQDKHKQGLDDCGGNLSLRTYCTENPWPGTSRPSMTRILPWLSVLGLLGLLKARSLILERKDRPGPRKGNNSPDQPSSDREGALLALLRKRAGGGFWVSKIGRAMKVILSLCQATLVGFVIYYIAAMGIRSSTDAYSASSTWNVGQVIAVLVWAPVVARYLYTVFFGVQRGFSIRLYDGFIVARQSDPTSERLEDQLKLPNRSQQQEAEQASLPSI